MSTAPRRRNAPPVAEGRVTFTIAVEGQPMVVRYERDYGFGLGHLEFRSPYKPLRPILISGTGYLSHFVAMAGVEAAECLNEHLFANLKEAREIIEEWRIDYNTNRPHTSLNGLTPTEFAARPNEGQNWNRLSL